MTKAVVCGAPDRPRIMAGQLIVDEGVHRVIVVDESKRWIGIVTPIDVCRAVRTGKALSDSPGDALQLRCTDLGVLRRASTSPRRAVSRPVYRREWIGESSSNV